MARTDFVLQVSDQGQVLKKAACETDLMEVFGLQEMGDEIRYDLSAGLLDAASQSSGMIPSELACYRPFNCLIELGRKNKRTCYPGFKKAVIQARKGILWLAHHLQKNVFESWFTLETKPLRFVLILVRAKTDQSSDL